MRERQLQQEPSSANQIIRKINDINDDIKSIFITRDEGLGEESQLADRVKRLHELKNQTIIDFLLLKDRGTAKIILRQFEGEIIHPFSINQVGIWVDSIKYLNVRYKINTELSDLRRKGVCDDSIQAEKLLGEKAIEKEYPHLFTKRTLRELMKIKAIRDDAEQNYGSRFVVDALDQMSSDIVNQRFVGQRGQLANQFYLRSRVEQNETTEEIISIAAGTLFTQIRWYGKRLQR